jgi:hypothetical protein
MNKTETMKQLLARHEREIKQLQKTCLHKHIIVAEYHWAIAHGTGRFYRWCKDCNKQLEEVYSDGSPIRDDEICRIHDHLKPCFICEAQSKL